MRIRFILPAAAAVVASGVFFGGFAGAQQAGGQKGAQPQGQTAGQSQSSGYDRYILENIHLGIQGDVSIAKICERKATSPELKKLAQTLIQDGQDIDKRVQAVAQGHQIRFEEGTVPAGMPREQAGEVGDLEKIVNLQRQVSRNMHQEVTQHLEKLQGVQFDRMSLHHFKMCNAFATTFLTAARNDADPTVRPLIEEALNKLQSQKTEIDQVAQTLMKSEGEGQQK
jgi:predicted outer membrane protein